jgi:hypothetical protein
MNTNPSKKCFANCHMTPEEFGFWEVSRSLSYKFNGKLIFDGRTLAYYFGDTGKNTIYRIAKQLQSKGWFVCTKKPKQAQGGKYCSAEYRVLDHTEWVEKHGIRHCKTPVPESGLEQEVNTPGQSQNREPSSPRIGNHPVPEPGHSTEETPLLWKKPSEELRSAKQEPLKDRILIEAENEHGNAEKVRPVPEPGLVARTYLQESDPFIGVPTSQLVSEMLPHETAMKLYHKFNKGTEYNEHRAEIIATVLQHQQKTREVA